MCLILGFVLFLLILFIVFKLWNFRCRSKACLVGKTAIVVGGVSGVGYEVALALAARGCRVIIADVMNTSPVVERIIKETHNPNVIGKKVDFQSFKSVREFAKEIKETESSLHILMCNAGIAEIKKTKKTEDGLQKTMQINYFSHFLLTSLLLELLKKSAPSRIVFTSSILAYLSSLKVETLEKSLKLEDGFTCHMLGGTYTDSKLVLAAAAKMFGDKLAGTGVTANAVILGGVKTSIFKKSIVTERNIMSLLLWIIVIILGKTVEEGAQMLIHAAIDDSLKDIPGQVLYEGMRVLGPSQINKEFCDKLWDLSIQYTKLDKDEIKC